MRLPYCTAFGVVPVKFVPFPLWVTSVCFVCSCCGDMVGVNCLFGNCLGCTSVGYGGVICSSDASLDLLVSHA